MSPLIKTGGLLLLVVLIAIAGGYSWVAIDHTDNDPAPAAPTETVSLQVTETACRDTRAACRATHPELGDISLRFPEGAYYMQRFEAELRLAKSTELDRVTLDLDMTEMDMGRNRFTLSPAGEGIWRGELLLPICVTGRVDWQVRVQLDRGERRYEAAFPLNVTRAPEQ
ncbi:hypothetical protein [Thiohalophilus thiocyanatoxydans]|uniref:FixH protein n=1 Tax=Thiohalophilus thiocyanatoxydans TaxID=381308 RepID=A0A4R8IK92_9GAMM|nr:hypothetical protein [Thiohalophilus thiocyanatoxydans]TDY01162.1 hypothetical protein EDC23_1909 [Thiohalophilus thiocyanatoxydans]